MKLIVTTVYENMTENQLQHWCERILDGDPSSKYVLDQIFKFKPVAISDCNPDPASMARKTTTFRIERK